MFAIGNPSTPGEPAFGAAELTARSSSFLRDRLRALLVVVRRLDQGSLSFIGGAGYISDAVRSAQPSLEVVLGRGQGVAQPRLTSGHPQPGEGPPEADVVETLVAYPLVSERDLQGVVSVGFAPGARVELEALNIIESVAAGLAAALSLEKRIQALEFRLRRDRQLMSVVTAASQAKGLPATLREVCSLVVDKSAAERCSIFLYRESERRLMPVMHTVKAGSPLELRKQAPLMWMDAMSQPGPIVAYNAQDLTVREPGWAAWIAAFDVKSLAAFPIEVGNRPLGMVMIDSVSRPVAFSLDEVQFLSAVAGQIGQLIERNELQDMLQEQALTDPLTSLYNRRYIENRLREEISRAERMGGITTICLIDVDGLKRINDTYGHLAGDEALTRLAGEIRRSSRAADTVGRIAGDEFVIIMPGTEKNAASNAVRRLRQTLQMAPLDLKGEAVTLDFSIGFAEFPRDGRSPRELLAAADAELYRDKPARQTTDSDGS